MPQSGLRFARIVIAVVVEEDDLAADFVTTARTDAEAKALLKAFDLPFAN